MVVYGKYRSDISPTTFQNIAYHYHNCINQNFASNIAKAQIRVSLPVLSVVGNTIYITRVFTLPVTRLPVSVF